MTRHVWIVEGEHHSVPGCPITAHATEHSANDEAADLVGLLLMDHPEIKGESTPANWRRLLKHYEKARENYEHVGRVEIIKRELKGAT